MNYLASTKRPNDGMIYHHYYIDYNTSQIYRTSLILDNKTCILCTFGTYIKGDIIRTPVVELIRPDMSAKLTNRLVYIEHIDDIVNLILEKILEKI